MSPVIIFIGLLFIPGILYSCASFYNVLKPSSNIYYAILIAIGFAIVEYIVKIPIIKYGYDNRITPFFIQFTWIAITLFMSYMITVYIDKEKRI
jgi:uncharacterized protein (DUF486 family)